MSCSERGEGREGEGGGAHIHTISLSLSLSFYLSPFLPLLVWNGLVEGGGTNDKGAVVVVMTRLASTMCVATNVRMVYR